MMIHKYAFILVVISREEAIHLCDEARWARYQYINIYTVTNLHHRFIFIYGYFHFGLVRAFGFLSI